MNKILRIVLPVVIAVNTVILSCSVNAENRPMADRQSDCRQSADCRKPDPKEHMTKMLALREGQIEAVMKVLKASREKRKNTQQVSREQHDVIFEKTLQQLEPLLDDEQMARFISFSEKMKKKHQQRMGPGGSAGGEMKNTQGRY